MACFMSWLWHVLWPQLGGYCGQWKNLFLGWFRVKMSCIGTAKELSGTLLRRSHAIVWLGFEIAALGDAIAWVLAQLRSPCTLSNLKL